MARRPVFMPDVASGGVQTAEIEFTWVPGLSLVQKQRNIVALHAAAAPIVSGANILEVSSRSIEPVGRALSAFMLRLPSPAVPVECAFQAGKVFKHGGPYVDLLAVSPSDAKRDPRLLTSGELVGFRFDYTDWPLRPPTAFYDWLYAQALLAAPALATAASKFGAFTDIEFNPARSVNCQAHALARFIALIKHGEGEQALREPATFLRASTATPATLF